MGLNSVMEKYIKGFGRTESHKTKGDCLSGEMGLCSMDVSWQELNMATAPANCLV